MLAALGPMAFALALLAFMPNLWTTALMLFALFFAYYVYEPPYRGLYPDVLPDRVFGRAQGVQHVFRGIALGGALIGGGFLFHLWRPAPFLVAAGVVSVACLVPIALSPRTVATAACSRVCGRTSRTPGGCSARTAMSRRSSSRTRPGRGIRRRAHVRRPLRHRRAGRAARHVDVHPRCRRGRVHRRGARRRAHRRPDRAGACDHRASAVYGVGLLAGGLGREWHAWYLALIFVVAIAGGTVMTLAWGLLFKLMPAGDRGAVSVWRRPRRASAS